MTQSTLQARLSGLEGCPGAVHCDNGCTAPAAATVNATVNVTVDATISATVSAAVNATVDVTSGYEIRLKR